MELKTKFKLNLDFRALLPLFISLLFIAMLAGIVKIIAKLGYSITYVASPSIPAGFYFITPFKKNFQLYDIVQFRPPLKIQQFLTQHHWGTSNALLLKYVYGLPGDFVCVRDKAVWVNQQRIATVHKYYAPNQLLPSHNFCAKLTNDQYLLLSTKHDRSFDGRYFGPVNRKDIIGKAAIIKI